MDQTVAVVGCGLIGRSWAVAFARGGWRVRLFDRDPLVAEEATRFVARVAGELEASDLSAGRTAAAIRSAVAVSASLGDALDPAARVPENTPERADVKTAAFAELDALARPDAVVARSSSALLPSEFTACRRSSWCRRRGRCGRRLRAPPRRWWGSGRCRSR